MRRRRATATRRCRRHWRRATGGNECRGDHQDEEQREVLLQALHDELLCRVKGALYYHKFNGSRNTFGATGSVANTLTLHINRVVPAAMAKRLLIVDPADTATESVACCRAMGIEPILLPEDAAGTINADTIRATAKAAPVDGIWASVPEWWSESVATRLGMPRPPQIALSNLLPTGRWVQSEAEAAGDELGVPAWVRADGAIGSEWCMRIQHVADIALAFRTTRKKGSGGRAFVQRAVVGESFRLIGFKLGRDFHPVAIVCEAYIDGPFRVIASCTAPVSVCGNTHSEVVHAARNVCSLLEPEHGLIEIEVVLGEAGTTVVDVRVGRSIDPVRRALLQIAFGVDLLQEALRVAVGEAPRIQPSREVGAAVCWLKSRSGIVGAVSGVDEARGHKGVAEVVVNV